MKFIPGMSGNPNGRPIGSKDYRSAFRELVENRKEELVGKAVELALAGNEQMLKCSKGYYPLGQKKNLYKLLLI